MNITALRFLSNYTRQISQYFFSATVHTWSYNVWDLDTSIHDNMNGNGKKYLENIFSKNFRYIN
jgi:hypothetical protein